MASSSGSSGSSGPPGINGAGHRFHPPAGRGAPSRESGAWGKTSVKPVVPDPLSSQLAASQSNPDIAEGPPIEATRLSDRAPSDASDLSSYNELGSVEFEVSGTLDEDLQKDLLEDKVSQSDLNDDQKQAAAENIDRGLQCFGFSKKTH